MSIKRITEFEAAENKSKDLYDLLVSVKEFILNSNGIISCEVLTEEETLNKFIVIEEWKSKEDHQNSLKNYPPEKMQAAMSLIAAPPKGKYFKTNY